MRVREKVGWEKRSVIKLGEEWMHVPRWSWSSIPKLHVLVFASVVRVDMRCAHGANACSGCVVVYV